jgi:DinB superfamily
MDLRYPIGPCEYPASVSPEARTQHIRDIAALPERLGAAVQGIHEKLLDTPYRPGGWTVRQVVHHLADSHMNAFVRFRLALTESQPTIKPYDEKIWAELVDSRSAPIKPSLELLDGLHHRWVLLLSAMSDGDFARVFHHPEVGALRLDTYLATYGWHCRHHVAHILNLRPSIVPLGGL